MAQNPVKDKNRVCPVGCAAGLDNIFRRWVQNPGKILNGFLHEGMAVLDIGCGPGFFTIEMANMVGKTGRVFACDLQDGMLEKVKAKIQGTELADRITLHKTGKNEIGIGEQVDFILIFYMLHEVPDKDGFFKELKSLLKKDGKILIVEPNFHVSKDEFGKSMTNAEKAGLKSMGGPKIIMSRSAVLKIAEQQ
jgi:ubiquinone/menaquinone biosynthesis C-methylase UbiE